MTELPKTIHTPDGLSVEGASPELLISLLGEYESALEGLRPGCAEAFRPGLPADAIISRFAPLGYVPNDEVIAWWGWHDGLHDSDLNPPGVTPFRLDAAVDLVLKMHRGVVRPPDWLFDTWHPAWIPFDYTATLAIRGDSAQVPPPVRPQQPEMGDHTQDAPAPAQVISLCTPVTWWITAIREGWRRWDEERGMIWAFRDEYPPEWSDTRLV